MKSAKVRKPSKMEELASAVADDHKHADSRVIRRNREVAAFELSAALEHIDGLKASLAQVQAKKAWLEARIAGMTMVLERR